MTRIIGSLAEVSANYDALFVDLWGCMHNGLSPFDSAVRAMQDFRAGGGTVVFVTNAPRSRAEVAKQLAVIGVPDDTWDTIATSGDSARSAMFRGAVGSRVWFMGLDSDKTFFEPLHLIDDPVEITEVALEEAEGIVCCGPFDAFADPAVNRPAFLAAKARGLKLLCANPDIVVDRGETREWCAGALAQLYSEMGGESLYFGKPHPPIYDLARRRLAAAGRSVPDSRILAIGDGIATDVAGALGEDIDSLFVSGGLAAAETLTPPGGQPDREALEAFLGREQYAPQFAIGQLR